MESTEANTPAGATPRPLTTEDVLLPESFGQAEGLADWVDLFGRKAPVELEIGSGKGTFLLARGRSRPGVNLLGIEYAREFCHYAADRVRRAGLRNVRLLRTEAEAFVRTRVPDGSLWRLHIYFPDPWPKTKHRKRRLIQPAFVDLARRKLRIGGLLLLVTDHANYARQMAQVVLSQHGLAPVAFPKGPGAGDGELVGTNFERKYIAQGRAFFSFATMRWR
jgi:tRNA (guanine-N7-)-methyltransferase